METMKGELQFATRTVEQYDVKIKQLEDQLRESSRKVHITSRDKHVQYTSNFLCPNLLVCSFFIHSAMDHLQSNIGHIKWHSASVHPYAWCNSSSSAWILMKVGMKEYYQELWTNFSSNNHFTCVTACISSTTHYTFIRARKHFKDNS
jgi:hypothetical protein